MDSSRKNKFRRRKRQELNEKRRLRRAKKALDAEAKGLRKRRLNMRTRELLHKANGKPLAKEVLEECMLSMLALSEHRVSMTTATCAAAYAPLGTAHWEPRPRPLAPAFSVTWSSR